MRKLARTSKTRFESDSEISRDSNREIVHLDYAV